MGEEETGQCPSRWSGTPRTEGLLRAALGTVPKAPFKDGSE